MARFKYDVPSEGCVRNDRKDHSIIVLTRPSPCLCQISVCPPMDPSLAACTTLCHPQAHVSSSFLPSWPVCSLFAYTSVSVHGAQSVHRVHPNQGGGRQRRARGRERERSGAAFDLTAKADRQKAFFCGLRESFKPTSKT